MKLLAFTIAVLLACACPSWADDQLSGQQLLDSARTPGDLFQGKAGPFHLEVDFTWQSQASVQGHLSLKWESKVHWWRKIEVGGFAQTTIRNGEMEYTVGNFGHTPARVRELLRLLRMDGNYSRYTAIEQKVRTVDGVPEPCVEAQREDLKGNRRELCFDPASHELRSVAWQDESEEKDIERFGDYVELRGVGYPRKLELSQGGEESLSATVATLESAAFDPALLMPPQGAVERRKCAGMQPPVSVRRVAPMFNGPGIEGEVTAMLTVLTDGSVGDVEILHSGGAAMDKASLDAFRKFTFRPAMCGAEPVVTDTEISVSVRQR